MSSHLQNRRRALLSLAVIGALGTVAWFHGSRLSGRLYWTPADLVIAKETIAPCPNIRGSTAAPCDPAFPGMHELASVPPYGCRMTGIRERCQERGLKPLKAASPNFKFGKKVALIMCEMPKVASTTWQAVLMKVNGFQGEVTTELIHKYAYEKFPLETLAGKSEAEASRILAKYTTFMITRHPFERLVSAHSDKFTNRSSMTSYRRTRGIPIAKSQAADHLHGISLKEALGSTEKLRQSKAFKTLKPDQQADVIRYQHVLRTGEISFPQFIKFVLSFATKPANLDHHWRPQVLVCQPCSFNYSLVLRFEHLAQESDLVLKFIQRGQDTDVTFPGHSAPAIQHPGTVAAFRLIAKDDVTKLRELFRDDFYVLGHDPYRYDGHP